MTQERSVVFGPGECDTTGECYPYFRIPALKRAKSGALLAFAEARGGHSGSGSDHGDVQIVMRASADGSGANGTWGKIYKVASEDKHTIGNPSPVVDLSTGTVFCHFARDNFDAFVTQSTDEGKPSSPPSFPPTPTSLSRRLLTLCAGKTWSNRTALDASIKVPGSGWYGSGVGGGTQLPSGRLLILSEERKGFCADAKTHCKPCTKSDNCLTTGYNAVPVYSDDQGSSWQRGGFLPIADNSSHGAGEPSVSLLGNSSTDLIMSARGAGHPTVSFSLSQDGGLHWQQTQVIGAINSPGCQSPVSGMYGGAGALITSPVGKSRADLQLFHATHAGGLRNWASLGTLWPGQAGYSSLMATESLEPGKGNKGDEYMVLFEEGQKSGAMYQYLSLIKFNITAQ